MVPITYFCKNTRLLKTPEHRAGFVSIIGRPNVGKSTLMNALLGEKLSIVTPKAQTTRHRIFGILNGADYQVVYSDTPGILKPKYELHHNMMRFVTSSLEDADLVMVVTDTTEAPYEDDTFSKIQRSDSPVYLVINKIDLAQEDNFAERLKQWESILQPQAIFFISALKGTNTEQLLSAIVEKMPVHPPYFEKEDLSDRSERFFASEIIREKIFELYSDEIPYSCEVLIEDFKEKPDIIVIRASILVERDSQRPILIGKEGRSIKKLGISARESLEKFLDKKVYLETQIKVEPDWRNKGNLLQRFGY
ncbi:MAG: GTPase Era [Cytophagales bacterium]|nr:GTPase Era [Cytophagales bacterium]